MMKGGQTSPFGRAIDALARLFADCGVEMPVDTSIDGALAAHRLPVGEWLDRALAPAITQGDARTREACAALARIAPSLCWRQNATYRDAELLARYGYCELIGPAGHRRDARLALGVLLLAPRTCYPPHRHPANEIYIALAGRAEWRIDEGPWVARAPGEAIRHPSMAIHAMRTDEEPLLAAYVWTDHLDTPATLI